MNAHDNTQRLITGRQRSTSTVRGLALIGAASLALTLTGCGEDQPATPEAAVTVTETPSTSPSTSPETDTSTTAPDPATETSTPSETSSSPSETSTTPSGGGGGTAGTGKLPEGGAPYADGLVIAWGSGNRAEALRYATPEVVSTLFSAHSPGGPHWDQTGVEGAAGTIYVTYQDTETGQKVVLGVLNEAASKSTEHSVTRATFEG